MTERQIAAYSWIAAIGLFAAIVGVSKFGGSGVLYGLAVVALLIVYLLPWLTAAGRGSRHTAAVAVVNILFGWTLIGWGVALALAFAGERGAGQADSGTRACPMCAEPIKLAAVRCKHCGADVSNGAPGGAPAA
jgi:hypothetical protein